MWVFSRSFHYVHNLSHAYEGELISTRFTGATGRAYLFSKVVNLNYRYLCNVQIVSYFTFLKTSCLDPKNQHAQRIPLIPTLSIHPLTIS